MGVFQKAFKSIGEAIEDASSLDVVTFKGSIEGELNTDDMPDDFKKVIEKAKGNTDVKVKLLASTQVKLDGDVLAYFDTGITPEESKAHAELVALAQKTREATIEFVRRVVDMKDIG